VTMGGGGWNLLASAAKISFGVLDTWPFFLLAAAASPRMKAVVVITSLPLSWGRARSGILSTLVEMSRDVLTVGSTMRIPLLYRGEYSQWVERFINYLEEQTDGEAMINSIKNGDQPLPRVTPVSIAGTTSTEQPPLKDKSMWSDQEKR
nr:hypothetical protein [Tanacetum cinerariifolium]